MKINIKARLKNKTFIISILTLVVSFVYKLLAILEIVPQIGESEILELLSVGVNVLAFVGVFIDPTTEGVGDSVRALTYFTENDARKFEEVNIVE